MFFLPMYGINESIIDDRFFWITINGLVKWSPIWTSRSFNFATIKLIRIIGIIVRIRLDWK
jgi:hypothetical protein